jgi:hypothetical protein
VAADAFNPCPLSFSLPLQRSGGGGQNTRAVVGHGPEQWRLVGGRLLRDRTKSHFLFCTPSKYCTLVLESLAEKEETWRW